MLEQSSCGWLVKWRAVARDIPADARLGESIQGQCISLQTVEDDVYSVNGAHLYRGKLKSTNARSILVPSILKICESGNERTITKLIQLH